MNKLLTSIAALVTIAAAAMLIYIHFPWVITIERAGEVNKVQEKADVASPAPPLQTPPSFGPVPHVVVQAMPVPEPTPEAAPTPVPLPKARPKPMKKKSSAAKKLHTKWVEPVAKPFSFGDLFNAY